VTATCSSQGESTQIYIYDATFRALGQKWWIALSIFLALSFVIWLLLSRTVAGRHLYAMGGTEEAARMSGIRTDRLKWLAYCIGAGTSSIAGILYLGYVDHSDPATLGMGQELNAIAAAVVGGCSLAGGVGTVAGTMLGALFLRTAIDSVAKTVTRRPDEFEGLMVGGLVVIAVALNELRTSGGLKKQLFPGLLGIVNIFVLTVLCGAVTATASSENKLITGGIVAAVVFALLLVKKIYESRANKATITTS
jgi:ribose/xylose/arabinose/galactoside ABC-type transport system permease subunit